MCQISNLHAVSQRASHVAPELPSSAYATHLVEISRRIGVWVSLLAATTNAMFTTRRLESESWFPCAKSFPVIETCNQYRSGKGKTDPTPLSPRLTRIKSCSHSLSHFWREGDGYGKLATLRVANEPPHEAD